MENEFLETIGNGLCRFHLGREEDTEKASVLLAKLFVMTAKEHIGSEKVFRDTYNPHYRLLRAEYAFYFNVLKTIQKQADIGKAIIVSIDGRCGSGKTCLAEVIRRVFPCNVFHMDDYYLPMNKRKKNWEQLPGGNIDFERFEQDVLTPAVNGGTITYRPFDCQSGMYKSMEQVQPCKLTVVEGSYSGHPLIADKYDLKIFLTCSKEVQSMRLKEREGENYHAFEQRWIPMEENYMQKCDVLKNSNMIIDTSEFFKERGISFP